MFNGFSAELRLLGHETAPEAYDNLLVDYRCV